MEEEINYLNHTLKKYAEVIDDSNLKLNHLRELYKFDYETFLDEKFKLENDIKSIEKAKLNPYFARIDFKSINNFDKCYIGKKGVIDYDNNIITVDWRAPIANLYYDSNVGECEYVAPEGIISGELLLKRQYTIENSKLITFADVDIVANDELLKPYLTTSADNRLKNIVSTIQSEQNQIIRKPINQNLIIQGVAGSGKTTVALHRIAYLVYNHRDLFKASDYMVIGPNKFFVSYISKVLPDLDVNGVIQNTLEELFQTYVKEKFIINNSLNIIKAKDEVAHFKISMKLKTEIDNYFSNLKIIPDEDLIIHNVKIIDKAIINNIYVELDHNLFTSIKSRVDRLILLLNKHINDNINTISRKFITNKVSQKELNEFKNNLNNHLKKYFTVMNIKIKKIYSEILEKNNIDTSELDKNIINIEDIPALTYINYKLYGSREFDNYKHIVIDEAQDYGEFTFYVLNKIFRNATFSIYGDLAQSLYPYRSLKNWKCLENIFEKLEILKLNKSYRTTIEIMNEANKINELLKLYQAIPVIRHGEEVEYFDTDLKDLLQQLKDKYQTIAIITKDQEKANFLYEELNSKLEVILITKDNLDYEGNITILPSYLAKGLEFDCVIIMNENDFNKNNPLDLKLLYVSKTRALHKLYIKK